MQRLPILRVSSKSRDTCNTCIYAFDMSRVIQIRNVPDSIHRTLKARAAKVGTSLSHFLLMELRRLAEQPTIAELRERLRLRSSVAAVSPADAVRRERDAR